MKLTFIGAAHEVTGSCHYLEACGKHILIDCGLEQGPDLYENQEIPINPSMIDYILLTHAHIDHSGKIPLLVKNGFKGEIICTFATSDLCSIMLRDSAHIQESEAEWRNRKALRSGAPLCEAAHVIAPYHRTLDKVTERFLGKHRRQDRLRHACGRWLRGHDGIRLRSEERRVGKECRL